MENTETLASVEAETQTETAQTEAEVEATEETEGETTEPALLSLTQEELDERIRKATKKAAAIAERKTRQRLQAEQAIQQGEQKVKEIPAPRRELYASEDDYIDARIAYRDAVMAQQENVKAEAEFHAAMAEKVEDLLDEASEFPEFDRDSLMSIAFTDAMNEFVLDSAKGAKILAFLSANPDEQERIAKIKSPVRQVAEMSKIEDKLSIRPKKDAKPVEPVKGTNVQQKNLENMSQAEYEAYRRKQGAVWARRF
jgi:hypothetical protein